MKEAGLDDWLVDTISDLYTLYRKGYASQMSPAIEEVTGRRATTFAQFAKDHADAFR
jgi:hypothetical protein